MSSQAQQTQPGNGGTAIRSDWAHAVAAHCQRVAGDSSRGDARHFARSVDVLARALPNADGAAERLFLRDRLREFSETGGHFFHERFHRGRAAACSGQVNNLARTMWSAWDPTDDPRHTLSSWAARYAGAFDAEHVWPPALRAAAILRESPEEPLNLDALARMVNASRSALIRSFQKEYGQSAGELLAEIRVERAVEALRTTEWSVEAIARIVGYRSEANLYVAIKRQLGMTPAAVRLRRPLPINGCRTDCTRRPASRRRHRDS